MKDLMETIVTEKVDVKDYRIDCEKYDIIDFTYIGKDQVFYKNRVKSISAEEYLYESLDKGFGVKYGDTVYYKKNMAPDIINAKKPLLKEYLRSIEEAKRVDKYRIQRFLINPEDEVLVNNIIRLYKSDFKLSGLDWIKQKLENRVRDVDEFMQYLCA